MPLPSEYQRASDHFYSFLTELRDVSNFGSSHQTYTMTQSVFQVFRSRLQLNEAIIFSNALPAALRAVFVADWDTDVSVKSFTNLATMNLEVKQLRPKHNFSTATAIQDVGNVLRRYVDTKVFDAALEQLPQGARAFWYCGEAQNLNPSSQEKHICICGSMRFIDEMESLEAELRSAGFTVTLPQREGAKMDWESLPNKQSRKLKKTYIDDHLENIRHADLVLIANYNKQGVPGYIGANTLIEAAFAYALEIPVVYIEKPGEQNCKLEAMAISDQVVGNGVAAALAEGQYFK